jgi:hypothetical protein
MSDTGLFSGLHHQLRGHAELLDRVLVRLKAGTSAAADPDRQTLAAVLRGLNQPTSADPAVRMLALVLRGHAKGLVKGWGEAAEALTATAPVPEVVVERLETLALALDDERAGAAKRMRGVRP